VLGLWIVLPWPFVYRASFERAGFRRGGHEPFLRSILSLARHDAYLRLTGLFLLGRVAIDLASTMFIYYFTYWLGRPDDFMITMGLFLASVVVGLPLWNAISRRVEKRMIYVLGAISWVGSQLFLLAATPEWPRAWIFVGAAIGGIGYAAADMIPWSMLGEVVDEDELRSGHRREGLYFGLFTFLRKLGGAAAVALGLFVLELSGYVANQAQSQTTLTTIRVLTAVVPDGGRVRLLRHRRGWSRRALVHAVAKASERESGLPTTVTLNQLGWIEETNEPVPFATVRLLASGLDCEPVELVRVSEA